MKAESDNRPKQKVQAIFNDKTDPTYEFENQCIAYIRVCRKCGTRFESTDTHCQNCGAVRPRCRHRAMEGEQVCRSHSHGRPYSIYSILAGTLSDTVLEEIIEKDDRDLSQEYSLAKVALSHALENYENVDSKELMSMVRDFFTIAEKRKNIEQGQVLNVAWDDKMVSAMRIRMRKMILTFSDILEQYIPDEGKRKEALKELRERTALVGNSLTIPSMDEYYKENDD